MEEKLLKQISENAVCIARISEDNLALRKECNAKSFNDFGLFQEHFNHRPKEELLAKRRKSFQVASWVKRSFDVVARQVKNYHEKPCRHL